VALLTWVIDLGVDVLAMCSFNLLPKKIDPNSNYTHDAFGYCKMKLNNIRQLLLLNNAPSTTVSYHQ
jgi:hypothetical protein